MYFGIIFSSEVPGLFGEFVKFLPLGFGGQITPKVIGDKSVALNNCSLFENKYVWVALQDKV